jgi:putative restriction endonuclease
VFAERVECGDVYILFGNPRAVYEQPFAPLIYFHGIVEGKYEAEYPVFIVGDSPESLAFTVTVDERRFASLGNVPDDSAETDYRRRYVTRTVQQRLHQQEFRERVLEAYQRHCAVCRLKREQLLEAAHIVADRDPLGAPMVPNGIALCSLHHAAFDGHLMTVLPDYRIELRQDVLEETDGPMLIHGLQGFHGKLIHVLGSAIATSPRDGPSRTAKWNGAIASTTRNSGAASHSLV